MLKPFGSRKVSKSLALIGRGTVATTRFKSTGAGSNLAPCTACADTWAARQEQVITRTTSLGIILLARMHSPSGTLLLTRLTVHLIRCVPLEGQFQGDLQGSGSAALKQRIEAAEALIQHLCRLKFKGTVLNITGWIGEVGVIEHVESVGSKLQPDSVSERKQPAKRKIDLCETKSRDVVSSFCSLANR